MYDAFDMAGLYQLKIISNLFVIHDHVCIVSDSLYKQTVADVRPGLRRRLLQLVHFPLEGNVAHCADSFLLHYAVFMGVRLS